MKAARQSRGWMHITRQVADMKLWQILLKLDADIDLTDGEALFHWFATRIAMRDGALDVDEALEATYAMGIADKIIKTFAQTPGRRAVGTRDYGGQGIILASGDTPPHAFEYLFRSVNRDFVDSIPGQPFPRWEIAAGQPFDPEPVEELDEEGSTIIVPRIMPYRRVPQSIRPWLERAPDDQGVEIEGDPILTPSSIGGIMGAAEWVVEETD